MKDRKRTGARMVRERRDSWISWWWGVGELGVVGGERCLVGIVEVGDVEADDGVTFRDTQKRLLRLFCELSQHEGDGFVQLTHDASHSRNSTYLKRGSAMLNLWKVVMFLNVAGSMSTAH